MVSIVIDTNRTTCTCTDNFVIFLGVLFFYHVFTLVVYHDLDISCLVLVLWALSAQILMWALAVGTVNSVLALVCGFVKVIGHAAVSGGLHTF